jgi:hypothetical protein
MGVAFTVPEPDDAAKIAAIEADGALVSRSAGGWSVAYHLRGRSVGKGRLSKLAELGRIVELNLRDTDVTDADLAHLAKLGGLHRLHLERTEVGDDALVHLAELGALEYLNLYGTRVSDSGLEKLRGLTGLRKLFVWETEVTPEGAASLERVLPDLEVVLGVDLDKPVFADGTVEKTEPPEDLEWVPIGVDAPPRSQTGSFVMVTFKNQRKQRVKLFWVEYGGALRHYAEIEPGAEREQTTYSKATWLIKSDEGVPLGYFRTTLKPGIAVIPAG